MFFRFIEFDERCIRIQTLGIHMAGFKIYKLSKSSMYVCMVNIKFKYNFVETPRKFIIAKLSIRKLGSSSGIIIMAVLLALMKIRAYGTDRKLCNNNLRGVSTKLYLKLSKNISKFGEILQIHPAIFSPGVFRFPLTMLTGWVRFTGPQYLPHVVVVTLLLWRN